MDKLSVFTVVFLFSFRRRSLVKEQEEEEEGFPLSRKRRQERPFPLPLSSSSFLRTIGKVENSSEKVTFAKKSFIKLRIYFTSITSLKKARHN